MTSINILVADDHAMIRDGLKNLIQANASYRIAGEATSGEDTLQKYRALQPDLLIIDISMPGMNGMDVSQTILEERPDAKIIVFSMYDGEEYVSRCLEIGVKGYVLKSEPGSELEHAIRTVLQGSSYFSRQAQNVILGKYTRQVTRKKRAEELIKLTQREIEIVKLIAEGFTSQQMADKLFISPRTVETHRANLMKKVGVRNAVELVKKINELQLI